MSRSMERACISQHPSGAVLRIRAIPSAARTEAAGLVADAGGKQRLAVRVKAPPVEGKANLALRRWAAESFGLRKGEVGILRGEKSREKDLLLEGMDARRAGEIVARLLSEGDRRD